MRTGYGSTSRDVELGQREELLRGAERLSAVGSRLDDSTKLLRQSEAIGEEVLGRLHHQRGQLKRGVESLDETREEVEWSRRMLRSMGCKQRLMTCVCWAMVVMCFGILATVIYFALRRGQR
mmetsp:Transcript_2495/g.9147  ORF Transcript_2495/g.9147 Transcript_2495/m.9147 type:complete len:122 (+) Transcript_2495:115-480(+)